MADESPNPYAPTEALQHDLPPATTSGRRIGYRIGAIVLAILAYPLSGAGFYVLGRPQRLARWLPAAVLIWVLMIAGIRTFHPKLFMIAFAAMFAVALASIVATGFAARGALPAAGRAWLVAIAFVVAAKGGSLAVKHFLTEAFQMPSGSMIPTLLVGDHMFISKGRSNIGRGDVIVFEFPQDRRTDYIKRVVAIGGDRIEIKDGVPSINGVPLAHEPLDTPCEFKDDDPRFAHDSGACKFVRETLDGHTYTVMFEPDRAAGDTPSTVVPPDEVFVVGDNRDNSHDSRKWGSVPVDHIKGKASITWWSQDHQGAIRWPRVGKAIE
jgi:signal peptidase I